MPAIWAAKLPAIAIEKFTEVYYFVGRERVLENNITVLAEMWVGVLGGHLSFGGRSFVFSL